MAQTATTGTVAGFFDSETQASKAMDDLMEAGFTQNQIGMALSSGTGAGAAQPLESGDRGSSVGGAVGSAVNRTEQAGEGMWDKMKNFFSGNEAEPYAGETSRGASGTREITDDNYGTGYDNDGYTDAVHHSLSGLSVPTERASYFNNRFGQGHEGAVVTVSAGNREAEAEAILRRNGADLGDEPQNFANTTPVANETAAQQNIRLYGEVLRVHKDRISRGEVRLRKETITDTQTIQVPVTREELVIERVPVSGEVAAAGTDAFADQEIRIPLSEERASVDKQAVVQEEIHVGKREVGSTQSFDETVRHEQLKVEDQTKTVAGDVTRSGDVSRTGDKY